MPRRFTDAETISATGAFLVGELERLDARVYEPIADFTYGNGISTCAMMSRSPMRFLLSFSLNTWADSAAQVRVKSPSLRARIPRLPAFLFL